MNTVEKILKLMNENKITAVKLEKEIGLTNGTISNWKREKNKPSAEALKKVADYFKISTDYLLNDNEENKKPMLQHMSFEEFQNALNKRGIGEQQAQELADKISNLSIEQIKVLEEVIKNFK